MILLLLLLLLLLLRLLLLLLLLLWLLCTLIPIVCHSRPNIVAPDVRIRSVH